jgi:lipopolysaccharide biosynthesis glycosyltransferase
MRSKLNIVFTIDERFIQHFTVTLTSVLENNRDIDVTVFVLHDIADTTILQNVASFARENYSAVVHLMFVENSLFESYRISLHYSKSVYYRLIITDLLPTDVNSALFLDADIVVTGSLLELADYHFKSGKYLLAVHDVSRDNNIERLNKLGFPLTEYFNAGVLLINVKAWRDERVSTQLLDLANRYMDKIAWWDQDILNMYFYGKWKPIDKKYNALLLDSRLPEMPIIIHYGGAEKPWLYSQDHPYKEQYWKYIRMSPFKNAKFPDYNIKEVLRKRYIKLLNLLGLRKK